MKILIWTMARALGDGIMLSGYPRQIKKIYPDSQLDIMCTKMHAAALKNNPFIDNIYLFNTYNKFFSNVPRTKIFFNPLFHFPNLIKLKKQQYDILIDTDTSHKWNNLFMIKFILGANYIAKGKQLSGKLYTANIKYYDKLSKIYTFLAKDWSLGEYKTAYSVIDTDIDNNAASELFISSDKENKAIQYYQNKCGNCKKIIFNGEGSDKTISSSRIITTLKNILSAFPLYHIFILGYNAYYDKYYDIISQINSDRVHITYKTDIQDTMALIKYADLLISVDTSLIHIASAVSTKVCEIISYGKKNYVPILPYRTDYKICESQSNCFDLDAYVDTDILNSIKELCE